MLPFPCRIASSAFILTLSATAVEAPAWNLRNAAEQLLDQHSLRLPTGDWFLKARDGRVVQWEKPEMVFKKSTAGTWEAEVLSRRWREYKFGKWAAWNDARLKFNDWSVAKIALDAPSAGGATAAFSSGQDNFLFFTPPGAAYIAQIR
jgi:hypothetical protein